MAHQVEKNSDMNCVPLSVVAGALRRGDGLWLMQKRPPEKHHGGLWEFPGGKVEQGETPVNALVRELAEELDIGVIAENCAPAGSAQSAGGEDHLPIVIVLYTVSDWSGDPRACEGGEVGWFDRAAICALDKPPLDISLAEQLFAQ